MHKPSLILFADRHYGSHPGAVQATLLRDIANVVYIEEDYDELIKQLKARPDAMLALNAIAGTPGNEILPESLEPFIRSHVEGGSSLCLLHGGSAAFWPWAWWRKLMRVRWVRADDPDGAPASHHPIRPYTLELSAEGEKLFPSIGNIDVPKDEMYVGLEIKNTFTTYASVYAEGRHWPQVYAYPSPWGGVICGFIPGHDAESICSPGLAHFFQNFMQERLSP